MSIQSVNIIGTGKVGTNLIDWFNKKNIEIKSVFSRHVSKHPALKNCNVVGDIQLIDHSSDLTIICVKDDEIGNVTRFLPTHLSVVHTSGSVPVSELKMFHNYGIMYPLQTFTENRKLDLTSNYFLLEASKGFELELEFFCRTVFSDKILFFNSDQRSIVHLAAVFANNFTNHLLQQSKIILASNDIDFEILRPLVEETIHKAFEIGPDKSQTGPAVRRDLHTIEKQENLLVDKNVRKLYQAVTESILKSHY